MFGMLLQAVGTDKKPDLTVSNSDSLGAWFSQNADEAIFIFIIGICVGIAITFAVKKISEHLDKNNSNKERD